MKGQGRGEGRCGGGVCMCVCVCVREKRGREGGGGKHSQLFFPFSLKSLITQKVARIQIMVFSA